MCYTVSAENVLTWALLKHEEGVSISFLKRFSQDVRKKLEDCAFDVSSKSVSAVVEDSDMFEWVDNLVVFSNNYKLDIRKIKSSLEYRLPEEVNKALATSNI